MEDVKEIGLLKKQTGLVCFIGEEYAEICLYLARGLNRMGKRVLVSDNSERKSITCCIPDYCNAGYKGGGMVEVENIHYTMDQEFSCDIYKEYDTVINICGYHYNPVMVRHSHTYVMTNMGRPAYVKMRELIPFMERPYNIVYNEVIDCNINPRYMEFALGIEDGRILNRYVLERNADDMVNALYAQHNGIVKLERLSPPYQRLILDMVKEICGNEDYNILNNYVTGRLHYRTASGMN